MFKPITRHGIGLFKFFCFYIAQTMWSAQLCMPDFEHDKRLAYGPLGSMPKMEIHTYYQYSSQKWQQYTHKQTKTKIQLQNNRKENTHHAHETAWNVPLIVSYYDNVTISKRNVQVHHSSTLTYCPHVALSLHHEGHCKTAQSFKCHL